MLAAASVPIRIDGRELILSNLEKPYWPHDGITKGELLAYYRRVAPYLLSHLRDRPLSLRRYPDGAGGEGFFQKQAPPHTPSWIQRVSIPTETRTIEFLLCQDLPSLLWMVNLGCIDQNPWHSRVPRYDEPDYVLIDLDPFPPAGLRQAIQVGLMVKEVLDLLGLRGYPKLSGATGFHVYIPIRSGYSFAAVRQFAGVVGRHLLAHNSRLVTMEWAIPRRAGKVFFDHNMNARGKTVASVYSSRPAPGAPVSVPLRWDEVHVALDPATFTIRTIFDRLQAMGDLFAPVLRDRQALEPAIGRLSELLSS